MSKLTKLELATENEVLRAQVADLKLKLETAEQLLEKAAVHAAHMARVYAAPAPRTQYEMPQWQAERAAVMAKAKALAMASGRPVKL